jgi:hypothetical protein
MQSHSAFGSAIIATILLLGWLTTAGADTLTIYCRGLQCGQGPVLAMRSWPPRRKIWPFLS